MSILSIDQGTSGTKAIVVDESGTVLSMVEVPVHPRYLGGGAVEQDPQELLDSVLTAGRGAVVEAGVPVAAVALANQGETVLAWDPHTGRPLSDAVVWQDSRSQVVCDTLVAHRDRIAKDTGLVLDPYFSAPKMRWLRDTVTREGIVTTTDAWLVHHLTGEIVTDVTTASRSLVLDIDTADWSAGLLEVFGLEGEVLPRIVDCDEVVGTTEAFGNDAPVAGLVVDQQAALFAEGCVAPGSVKCTYGTGAFLLGNAGARAPRSQVGLTTSVAWRTREGTAYCVDGQVFTAAAAVRWISELGLGEGAGELDASSARDSDGVLFVPALAGLAAPWWRSDATASFAGLSLATTRGHLVRAVLEGIAAQVADLVHAMAADLGSPVPALRVDGGLTRSTVLMQAQADLLQVPVEVYPSPHATALGAAAFAGLAIGQQRTIADVTGDWAPARVFEPQWSADRAADVMARWRAAVRTGLEAS